MSKQGPTRILLTGKQGCGKTTVVVDLAQRLAGRSTAGFVTEEIAEQGRRVGFQARSLRGQTAPLARIGHRSWVSVGRYGVDVQAFERLVVPELTRDPAQVDLFLIDEIGKMACFCPAFVRAVETLLETNASFVATVSIQGKDLIETIKQREDVELITVTPKNRDDLVDQLAERLG